MVEQNTFSDEFRFDWQRRRVLLFVFAMALPIAFSTWQALLNNFVVSQAGFDGADIGLLHMVREIPGFLAFTVVGLTLLLREQVLASLSLVLLGISTAVTAWFPNVSGLLLVTLFSSIGFHVFETVNTSLQLQWLDKKTAPKTMGWLSAAGSLATLGVYLVIALAWEPMGLTYNQVYMTSGLLCAMIAAAALLAFPQFKGGPVQSKRLLLRKRYWLYYALQFLGGARRQIFIIFAGFMMVERFGFEVHHLTWLMLVNLIARTLFAPMVGHIIHRFGERRALVFEYSGLVLLFLAYGGVYFVGWGIAVAAALYVVDHLLFSLALAQKTYFQKIADPADIMPTAAVSFTINHIAAVALPVPLGLMWLWSPGTVFVTAAGIAACSLVLSLLIPRHPEIGHETLLGR